MPQTTALTPIQDAKIEAATKLFDRYVASDQQVARYERELRTYVAAHPTWSIAESAVTVIDNVLSQPNYQQRGGDAGGSETDANFSIRGQFRNEILSALNSDPTVQRLQREERAAEVRRSEYIDTILASDPLINREMAVAAVDKIRTSLNNDTLEAVALAHAVNTMVHTTGASGIATAIEHGENPATVAGRNAGRYQEAKEDVVEVLRARGVSGLSDSDVTKIVDAAVPMARAAIQRREGNTP